MAKPILISGIQSDGRLHLGNYLGAIKNFVELQNSDKYDCYFFVADYHSLTVDFKPEEKKQQVYDVVKAYLAAGVDPKKSTIFIQSHVPESTELAWIFNTLIPLGELGRMTQFKEKKKRGDPIIEKLAKDFAKKIMKLQAKGQPIEEESIIYLSKINYETVKCYEQGESTKTGLLTYPLLMAADILLYDAKFVPVGEDQLQHLELTRTSARKFNKKFGETFIEPNAVLTKTSRVMSLGDPENKMSKSQPTTCLFLDDTEKDIEKKIKRSVTDSSSEVKYDLKNKAGISNLLSIYEALSGKSIKELEDKYKGKGYGDFKSDLARLVVEKLKPFREINLSDDKLKQIITNGDGKAKKLASKKMTDIKNKIGLI